MCIIRSVVCVEMCKVVDLYVGRLYVVDGMCVMFLL